MVINTRQISYWEETHLTANKQLKSQLSEYNLHYLAHNPPSFSNTIAHTIGHLKQSHWQHSPSFHLVNDNFYSWLQITQV